jgi:hypothetical protein
MCWLYTPLYTVARPGFFNLVFAKLKFIVLVWYKLNVLHQREVNVIKNDKWKQLYLI